METSDESGWGRTRSLVKKVDVGGGAGEALVEASTSPSSRRSPEDKED